MSRYPNSQTGFYEYPMYGHCEPDHECEDEFAQDEPEHEEYCERCAEMDEVHGPQCPEHPDYDPTPWCAGCGARRQSDCHCGPIAANN